MATMLAVDLLGCTGTNEERACLFHKMILIAAELKSNMGNMFGFAAVMRALELPQVGTTPHFKTHFALFAEKHCIYEAKLDSKNLDLRLTFLSCCFFFVHQVSRLEQTWVALRQRHTESAILYEKTLRPFMKRLDNGRGDVLDLY